MTLWSELCLFWTADTPALGGIERACLYGVLLLACHFSYLARPPLGDSPLQAPELFASTDLDLFFEVRGAIELVPLTWLRDIGRRGGIEVVRRIVYVSWVCCILGAFGHTPVVVTSVGMLFLEMIKISCTGVGHRMHVVVYMLSFLALSNGRRSHSVDEFLYRQYPDTWGAVFNPHDSHPILYSGLATKLGLVASSFTLWVGATTKICNGGWRWLDGSTLAWQTLSSPFGALPLMKKLFAIPAFATFSAVSAILFESGSFIIQFPQIRNWRFLWMLMCFAFHFVIFLTMNPNYLPQSLVYIPCVLSMSNLDYPPIDLLQPKFNSDPFGFACIVGSSLFFLALMVVAIFRIEYWPLTCVPMYSFYRGHFLPEVKRQSDLGRNLEEVGLTREQLQDLALEYRSINPRCIGWLDSWVDICLVPPGEKQRKRGGALAREEPTAYSLRQFIRTGRAARSLYRLALSKVVCETVLWESEGMRNGFSPADRYLEIMMSVLERPTSSKSKRDMESAAKNILPGAPWDLALCYRGPRGGWVVVGSVRYRMCM